jgi:hypothetical protein
MARPAEISASGAALERARTAWWVPALLVGVAFLARLGALLAHRHLTFDDGQYGVSVIDMRHGLAPYSGVFSSQGPLHYPVLYLGDLIGLRLRNAPRVTPIAAGAFAAVGIWACARRLGSAPGVAFGAGILTALTGSMLWTTSAISSDGPAAALAIGALWAALVVRDEGRTRDAVLAGIAFGAALAVKPLVFPFAIPIVWWLRSRRFVIVAAVAAALTWLATAIPWGLHAVWEESIKYHLDKTRSTSVSDNAVKIVNSVGTRDLVLLALVAVGIAVWLLRGTRVGATDLVVVLCWLAVTVFVLFAEAQFFRQHLVMVVPPLALLFALRPPPTKWIVIVVVVCAPIQLYQLSDILVPSAYPHDEADVVRMLRQLPTRERVITDENGLVWQAGLSTPPTFNDTSISRIQQRMITTATVLDATTQPDNCTVVIWSPRFGEHLPALRETLGLRGFERVKEWGPNRELWINSKCDAASRAADRAHRARAVGARGRSRD